MFFLNLEGLEGVLLIPNLVFSLMKRLFISVTSLQGRPMQLKKLLHVFPIVGYFVWQKSMIKLKVITTFSPE